jgi:hypothetical protein
MMPNTKSLFARQLSLFRRKQLPVPFHREFYHKPLGLLGNLKQE